jgi:hypothetical protein
MATVQVIVTYEFEVEDSDYKTMYDHAVSTPWELKEAIQADVHIYDDNWNEVTEDE